MRLRKLLNRFERPIILALFSCWIIGFGWTVWHATRSSPKPAAVIEQSDHHQSVKPNTEERLADYTWWLAILTGGLVLTALAQGFFIARSDKTATVAANAATKSADAAFAAERARFFIVVEHHNLTQVISNATQRGLLASGENFSIRFRFQNYGKTPAIVKVMTINSSIARDPVDPPIHFISTTDFPEYMIGAGGATKVDHYSPNPAPTLADVQAIGRNASRFWFYGRLYYDDVFGNPQVHRFYFRSTTVISSGDCALQPYEYKDHNRST